MPQINLSKKQVSKKQVSKTQESIKFFNFPVELKKENFDYGRVVRSNDEGISKFGQKKLIEFFTEEPLEISVARRKIIVFILMQQKMADKYSKISMESLCSFSGLSMDDLQHELYVLYRKVSLLKGDKDSYQEYRIPGFLYLNDILKTIKKRQEILQRTVSKK